MCVDDVTLELKESGKQWDNLCIFWEKKLEDALFVEH